jgi:predicted metal-dependent HD superfamily phosphohydrolase
MSGIHYPELIEKIKQYVVHLYKSRGEQKLAYHNLSHVESVVSNVLRLAKYYKLDERDTFIVSAAAWFHDTGYLNGEPLDHEKRSAILSRQLLQSLQVDDDLIRAVQQCILATQMPQSPTNLVERIVCDADLFHFGTDEFSERNKLMRKEAEWRLGKKIPKADWRKSTILFMQTHQFQTEYGRNLLQQKKDENLRLLKEKEGNEHHVVSSQPASTTGADNLLNKKNRSDRPERGIETMFRISSNNHQRLSDMADNKAHIMITTTSIIISVLLSLLLRKLEDNPQLILPTMLLLTVCVITMVFSILATRPNLPSGTFTQHDLDTRKVNLLFFGNFYKMSFDEYDVGMRQLMNDRDFLYGTLTKDVYSQGVVLGRKYRLLRKGYNVFMYGIVISVIAFLIASVFFR